MALIKCPECSKEISDTVKKCPNCGYKLKLQREGKKRFSILNKFKWWKILIIVLIIAVVAIGGAALYFYLNSPVRKTENYLKEGNIEQAQIIFDDKIKSDNDSITKLEKGLSDIFSSEIEAYAKDVNKYDAYEKTKNFVTTNYKDYDTASYDKQIEEIKTSKASYEEAKNMQSSEKYSYAISKYHKVIEKDSNYADAQKQIEQCKEAHKKLVLNEINKQISSSVPSYAEAESSIKNNDYLAQDKELSTKLTELKVKAKDYQVRSAEGLAKKNDYLKAMQALNAVPLEYSKDSKVVDTKNRIGNSMVKWATNKASTLAKKKKYKKAVEFLAQYKAYDTGNSISKQMSSYKKKIRKAIIAQFKALKSKLTLKYDSVDRDYTVVNKGYDTDYLNISRAINIEAQAIVDKKEKSAVFALIAGFQQDDWIFTEQIKFASGKYRETYIIEYSDRYTQVLDNGGGICEWVFLNDLNYSSLFDSMDKLVPKITTSKKVTMRFSADGSGSRNHTITSSEKSNIKKVYKFCQLLKEYDYLYKYI